MNLATQDFAIYNPIDKVEGIFGNNNFEFERRDANEVVVAIKGKWNDLLLFFTWEPNVNCLHFSCLLDVKAQIEDQNKIFELFTLINQEMWMGHFSYWQEEQMPIFKHSLFVEQNEDAFEKKLSQLTELGVKECERMYPIFKAVMQRGMDPKRAVGPLTLETVGNA